MCLPDTPQALLKGRQISAAAPPCPPGSWWVVPGTPVPNSSQEVIAVSCVLVESVTRGRALWHGVWKPSHQGWCGAFTAVASTAFNSRELEEPWLSPDCATAEPIGSHRNAAPWSVGDHVPLFCCRASHFLLGEQSRSG